MSELSPIELPSRCRISHRPTVQIQELVALSYGLHPSIMTSRNRDKPVAQTRQIAMYLTRQLTNRSLFCIGQSFGGRDHSTVFHAVRAVEARMESDPLMRADIDALMKALGELSRAFRERAIAEVERELEGRPL